MSLLEWVNYLFCCSCFVRIKYAYTITDKVEAVIFGDAIDDPGPIYTDDLQPKKEVRFNCDEVI